MASVKAPVFLRPLERKIPGISLPLMVVVLLYFFQLLFKSVYIELRQEWLGLIDYFANSIGEGLGLALGTGTSYVPDKFFLCIRYQVASVVAVYLLTSNVLTRRLACAALWFLAIQLAQVLRLFCLLSYPALVPGGPDGAHQLVFQIVLLMAPIVMAVFHKKLSPADLFHIAETPQDKHYTIRVIWIMLGLTLMRVSWEMLAPIATRIDRLLTAGYETPVMQWSQWTNNILTRIILLLTGAIVKLYGYQVQIVGIDISDGISSVGLGEPCIGKGVMLVYVVVVLLSKGPVWRKLGFIGIGVVSLLLLNAIRLSLLFAFVEEFGAARYNYDRWHSIYSSFIYLCVISFWWALYQFRR